jgi:hypothetical protein
MRSTNAIVADVCETITSSSSLGENMLKIMLEFISIQFKLSSCVCVCVQKVAAAAYMSSFIISMRQQQQQPEKNKYYHIAGAVVA